jgi:hypothetical protein
MKHLPGVMRRGQGVEPNASSADHRCRAHLLLQVPRSLCRSCLLALEAVSLRGLVQQAVLCLGARPAHRLKGLLQERLGWPRVWQRIWVELHKQHAVHQCMSQ